MPTRYEDYVLLQEDEHLMTDNEPKNYEEAKGDIAWVKAMKDEIQSIEENKTWLLCKPQKNAKVIGLKWVFKLKKDAAGNSIRY